MRRNRLALDDLIEIGGEDFRSASPKRIETARRVEKCWSLMARLSVCFADLEQDLNFVELIARPEERDRSARQSKTGNIIHPPTPRHKALTRARPWGSKPLPIDYEQCCSDQSVTNSVKNSVKNLRTKFL